MLQTLLNFALHLDEQLIVLIEQYGIFVYPILFLVIFIETGLVMIPFLPGDTLIFVAGTMAAVGSLNPYVIFILLAIAAIGGDTLNYWLGRYSGEKVFKKFINPEHLRKTELFYEHYGKKAIILARFIPIVRTIIPFVAGVGKMNYRIFLAYNVIGGTLWVAIFTFAGYFFGNFTFVKNNLTAITLAIIFVSVLPAIWEAIKKRPA
ncbi:MAG: VTT domain-containing protein [Candidatus Gracilibacteria bacterium]|jgi:membrane-associated protein